MKPLSRQFFALGITLAFAAAVWCASLAAPGQALASVTGCSQNSAPMKMAGCGQVLCGLEPSANILSQGGLNSPRNNETGKNACDLFIGEVPFDAATKAALIGRQSEQIFLNHSRYKVSTHLLNSTLNL
jgi:hypothetical protein